MKDKKDFFSKEQPKEKNITRVFIATTMILIVCLLTLLVVILLDKSKVINLANLDKELIQDLTMPKEEFKYGDVNQDGKINIEDVSLLEKYLSGTLEFSDTQKKVSDIDGDNEVTKIDLNIIREKVLEDITVIN